MSLPTESIGSIPRPLSLIEAVAPGDGTDSCLGSLSYEAIRDTIQPFRDDTSTSRDTVFAKFRAGVLGTALVSERLGGV